MQYRVKYPLYRVSASSSAEAKKRVIGILKGNLEQLIQVEELHNDEPLWKRLLTGK
jgi:soluble P-type ATPase